jgi:PAS domain S-box-containing protein
MSEGASCLEEVAQTISELLHQLFRDSRTGEQQVVMARFFKSYPYQDLPPDLHTVAGRALEGISVPEDLRCLVLLGSAGLEPGWNSRHDSRNHKVTPLLGQEHLAKTPMLVALFESLGWRPDGRGAENTDRACRVFLVEHALGHPSIPEQDSFVIPYGVRSVIGFGGVLGNGALFCIVLFTKVEVSRRVADMFRSLGLCAQLGIMPVHHRVFRDQASLSGPTKDGLTPGQLSELLAVYEENIRRQGEAEIFLLNALQVLPDSFFRFDRDGTILNYRDQAAFGPETSGKVFKGMRIGEVLPTPLSSQFETAIAQASVSGELVPLEYSLVDSGCRRTYEARFARLPADHHVLAVIRDVTARVEAEEQLRLRGRCSQIAAEMRRFASLEESEESLVRRCLGLIEEFAEGHSATIRFVNGEGEASFEFGQPAENAMSLPVRENGVLVAVLEVFMEADRDSGAVSENVQTLADVLWQSVKQKRSDLQIAKLAQALDQSPLSIVITNLVPQIEYVNEAFLQSTGYEIRELIGQNPKILNSGKTPPETYRDLWSSISRGHTWKGEFHNRRKDGSLYPEFAIVAPLRQPGGAITHYVAIKEDITLKKRNAEELDEHRHHLENLVQIRTAALAEKTTALELTAQFDRCESQVLASFNRRAPLADGLHRVLGILNHELGLSPCSIHLVDKESGLLMLGSSYGLSEAALESFHLPRELVEDNKGRKETLWFARDSTLAESFLGHAVKDDGACQGLNIVPLICLEGLLGVLTVGVWWSPDDPRSQLLRQLADQAAIAIQNQRQYERMVGLTDRLNEREQRIRRQNEALERANQLKSEFLANMSHELRTPLNAIIGFSEVMIDGLVGDLNEQQVDYAGEILSAGHYLLSLINDILDLSKIEAGKMQVQYSQIDSKQICENALTMVRERAKGNEVELSFDFDERVAPFWADERMFKQMLYNLLSNAVKFTKEGQVSLTCTLRDEPLCAVFSVKDTGIGISLEDQGNLFTPFQQVDGSASKEFEGTGLGLALCKELAELHGGKIALESELGVGSQFELHLPYLIEWTHAPSDKVGSSRKMEARLGSDGPLALIVEDEDPAAELLSLYLFTADWRVVRAKSLSEGRKLLAERRPQLVILDLLLPDLEGWSLLEEMKSDPDTAHIPVIVVSIIGEENRSKAIEMGAAGVLQKPISQARFLEFVASMTAGV